ncbi:uncharacterized protein LOC134242303, partial [Saccostrea cucullata]|uniref:uncharacterized protein LOC134242303 n=1 Tax=Saccostrea cuccullata TaxID=36930 RepID=UPI002ED46B2D
SNNSIIRCDGSERKGEILYIDFNKIREPCSCHVKPLFEGSLLIYAQQIVNSSCLTELIIDGDKIFNCPTDADVATSLDVNDTSSIKVISRYQANKRPGEFYHCVIVREKSAGSPGRLVKVTCGDKRIEVTTQNTNNSTNHTETPSIKYITEIYAIAGGILVCLVMIILAVICSRIQKSKAEKQGSNITIGTYTRSIRTHEYSFSENTVTSDNRQGTLEQRSRDFDNSSNAIEGEEIPNAQNMSTKEFSGDTVKYQVKVTDINMAQVAVLYQNQLNDKDLVCDILKQNVNFQHMNN